MSQNLKSLLIQINQLPRDEFDELWLALKNRAEKWERVKKLLTEIAGKGAGVWGNGDAQELVNQMREDDCRV